MIFMFRSSKWWSFFNSKFIATDDHCWINGYFDSLKPLLFWF
jgi:hypothetical protein